MLDFASFRVCVKVALNFPSQTGCSQAEKEFVSDYCCHHLTLSNFRHALLSQGKDIQEEQGTTKYKQNIMDIRNIMNININIITMVILIMVGWVVAYACQEWSSVHRSLRDLTTWLLHYIALNHSTTLCCKLQHFNLNTFCCIILHQIVSLITVHYIALSSITLCNIIAVLRCIAMYYMVA